MRAVSHGVRALGQRAPGSARASEPSRGTVDRGRRRRRCEGDGASGGPAPGLSFDRRPTTARWGALGRGWPRSPARSEQGCSRDNTRRGGGGGEGRVSAAAGRRRGATCRASTDGCRACVLAGSHHVGRPRSKGGWMTSTQVGDGVFSAELEAIATAAHDRLRADAGEDLAAGGEAQRRVAEAASAAIAAGAALSANRGSGAHRESCAPAARSARRSSSR